MGLIRFAVKKLLISVLTIFALVSITFFIFRILPGDPLRMMFRDPRVSIEQMEVIRKKFGLDKPLWTQYILYLEELLHGNLGLSYSQKRPVLEVIVMRIPQTLSLVVTAIGIATIIGVALGAVAGWKRGTKTDSTIVTFSLITYAIPTFCMGIGLVLIFSFGLSIFPLSGMATPASGFTGFEYLIDALRHMFLPATAIALGYLGEYVLLTRNSMRDILDQDFITTAWSKGLKEFTILKDHALRNALLPVVTLTGVNLGWAVSGAIQTETVFGWPGLGRLVFEALMKRDYPLLQGTFLVFGISVVLANLITDLIYAYIDPRVKVAR